MARKKGESRSGKGSHVKGEKFTGNRGVAKKWWWSVYQCIVRSGSGRVGHLSSSLAHCLVAVWYMELIRAHNARDAKTRKKYFPRRRGARNHVSRHQPSAVEHLVERPFTLCHHYLTDPISLIEHLDNPTNLLLLNVAIDSLNHFPFRQFPCLQTKNIHSPLRLHSKSELSEVVKRLELMSNAEDLKFFSLKCSKKNFNSDLTHHQDGSLTH